MSTKHEEIRDLDMFYCFVDIGKAHPDVWVIPERRLAEVVRNSQATWPATPD